MPIKTLYFYEGYIREERAKTICHSMSDLTVQTVENKSDFKLDVNVV